MAADVDPFGFGGVAGFAVVTFAGEHGDGVDGIPGEVAADAEAAVVIGGEIEGLVGGAGLGAGEVDDVGEGAVEGLLGDGDLPGFGEDFLVGGLAVVEEVVLGGEAVGGGLDELVEADLGGEFFAYLAHVPEVGVGGAELGFGPGEPDAAMPAMVFGVVASDEFAAGGIDGVEVGAVFEYGVDAFGDLAGLHLVVADELACGGEAEGGALFFGGDFGLGQGAEAGEEEDEGCLHLFRMERREGHCKGSENETGLVCR